MRVSSCAMYQAGHVDFADRQLKFDFANHVHGVCEARRSTPGAPSGLIRGWLSPAVYAAQLRSAAPRSTDGSAPRTAATAAHEGKTGRRSPLDKSSGQTQWSPTPCRSPDAHWVRFANFHRKRLPDFRLSPTH